MPRAPRTQIPIYIKNNPDNVFKRNHEGDYKCPPDNIRRMYADADIEHTHDELMTLATCCGEGEVTNYRLQIIIDKHSADITKLLKNLCDKGFLISCGFGRGTKYRINEDYKHTTFEKVASKVASSGVQKSTRKSLQTLRCEIVDACEDYMSLEDIAEKVGKGIRYLKNKIIPQMVDDELLERQYPDAPRHPYQKYKRKE